MNREAISPPESSRNRTEKLSLTSHVGNCYTFGVCAFIRRMSHICILVHASADRRTRNLFEMKENMIIPMRIDDTHDIIRSVYFNFGASQPPTRMRSANTHTHNANISAVMSFHAVKPNKEEMLKGK